MVTLATDCSRIPRQDRDGGVRANANAIVEGLMLHRNISASMAFLAIAALVAPIQSGEAEEAEARECLSRPNKAAPDGSHWWYRIDRSTHRRCWYLGQQRTA